MRLVSGRAGLPDVARWWGSAAAWACRFAGCGSVVGFGCCVGVLVCRMWLGGGMRLVIAHVGCRMWLRGGNRSARTCAPGPMSPGSQIRSRGRHPETPDVARRWDSAGQRGCLFAGCVSVVGSGQPVRVHPARCRRGVRSGRPGDTQRRRMWLGGGMRLVSADACLPDVARRWETVTPYADRTTGCRRGVTNGNPHDPHRPHDPHGPQGATTRPPAPVLRHQHPSSVTGMRDHTSQVSGAGAARCVERRGGAGGRARPRPTAASDSAGRPGCWSPARRRGARPGTG
jgi:hypothetical protein